MYTKGAELLLSNMTHFEALQSLDESRLALLLYMISIDKHSYPKTLDDWNAWMKEQMKQSEKSGV